MDSDAPLSKLIAPGNAMSFDGANDSVEISGYTGITGTDARTMEAWIKTTDTDAPILSWGTDADGEKWIFRVQNGSGTTGAIRVEVNGGYIVGSTVVSDGEWHHVAATFEADDDPDVADIKLYVDGGLETTSAVSGQTINTTPGNNVKIAIDHHNRYFKGQMDEVRIWNVARGQAEIQADMNRALGSYESGLEAYYRFDQASGAEVIDVTSFDHDGTISGGPEWLASDAFGNITPPGNALNFDGSDDYVALPVALNPATVGGFTVESWFKADSLNESKVILSQQDGTGTGRSWLYYNTSTGTLGANLNGTFLDSTVTPSVGVWYHIAMVHDGSVLSLYLNGELKASETWSVESADGNFILGANKLLASNFWDGAFDETRIWNTARADGHSSLHE